MIDTLELETLASCPLCGNDKQIGALLTTTDYETGTGNFHIVLCPECDLAFTNPRPTEASIPSLYGSRTTSDFTPRGDHGFVQRLRMKVIDRYIAGSISPARPSLHVLDFGCGDGALTSGILRFAARKGIESDVDAVDFHTDPPLALSHAGPNVRYMDYWKWGSQGRRYDAIFLRHVLEHHPAPVQLLEELGRSLNPGGILHIEVPNRASIWAEVFGRYFFAYYVPRHLMHFGRKSLRNAIDASGMTAISVDLGHTPVIGRSLGYRLSRDIDNLGFLGLATYPIQVLADILTGRSTTLRAATRK